jgi:CHAD domain-containing protein
VAKPRPIEGLDAEEPYAAAAAKVVAVRSREVADHSRDVLDVTDIERVHDMRVATRRLRAALEIFEPCFPESQYEEALEEVKAVADALGERRDADVAIASLERFAAGLAAPDRPGVASLVEQIRTEQAEANAGLEAFVQPRRLAALSERLSELVVEAEAVAAAESR